MGMLTLSVSALGQVLVDTIPFPGMLNLNFWGIHVTPDTIFLGADGPGHIYYANHAGDTLGHTASGYTYNHGLIKRPNSFLIASQYSTQGAKLHEIGLDGDSLDTWTFPPGLLASTSGSFNTGGVGGLNEAGDGAIWFTAYNPQSDTYPHTYAYKWVPGSPTFLDTVPLLGKQPYGITVKGDTLLYVIDNLQGDQERIYAYDLTNEEDLFSFELPDTPIDNDQRPFGMHWDGNYLYLVANRQGGSAWAHQTIFIYSFDQSVDVPLNQRAEEIRIYPNPASASLHIELPAAPRSSVRLQVHDVTGSIVHQENVSRLLNRVDVSQWPAGLYFVNLSEDGKPVTTQRLSITR